MRSVVIRKYRFGDPFKTEAAVMEHPVAEGKLPYFTVVTGKETVLSRRLPDGAPVLGLGQAVGPQNRRGRVFENWCTDEPNHTPAVKSLYGAHPYLLVAGEAPWLIWIDFPGHIRFDVGHGRRDLLEITLAGKDFDLWLLEGDSPEALVKAFRSLIGKPYLPPKWGLGYQQCRWSYEDREEVLRVALDLRRHQLPGDAVYLDIDYMERFKDFTVDEGAFPEMLGLVQELKTLGFRLIPIIDAGVKIEAGYPVYDEGVRNGWFCTDAQGKPFVAAVWPGRVHFPDFLNPEARRWFGDWYRVLLDMGFEGFWNDMNEPAIFYSEEGLEEALRAAQAAQGKNLDIYSFFELRHIFDRVSNRREDYQAMHHRVDGRLVSHADVHNLYGMNMTRAAAEGFEDYAPGKRVLMFSRASAIGAHRYGGIWTGDNHAWWEHLLLNIRMMPALGFCGFLYSGADTGGFGGDVSPELMIRWFQFSLFTPLFRNHAAMGTRRQEPYAFDRATLATLRNVLELRYALVPWLYSELLKAHGEDGLLFRPMLFDYPGPRAADADDQLLLGALMLAPVHQPGAGGRTVWLPEPMALWKAERWDHRVWQVLPAGEHYVPLRCEETPVFLRPEGMLLLGTPGLTVDAIDTKTLTAVVFLRQAAEYVYVDDDGHTLPAALAEPTRLHLKAWIEDGTVRTAATQTGPSRVETIRWEIIREDGSVERREERAQSECQC